MVCAHLCSVIPSGAGRSEISYSLTLSSRAEQDRSHISYSLTLSSRAEQDGSHISYSLTLSSRAEQDRSHANRSCGVEGPRACWRAPQASRGVLSTNLIESGAQENASQRQGRIHG